MEPASLLHRSSKTVCVMDASGELGSALVRSLLRRGYTVHAAQGAEGDANGAQHGDDDGHDDDNNNNNLKIFRSDPLDYQSIMDALKGCSGLFYAFEPPHHPPTAAAAACDESMVEDEVRAAHNVVEACARTATIAKAVFTSSVTATVWGGDRKSVDLDERHWSDVNLCRKFKLWHGLSKTAAEKTAWALAMDRGLNMVCVNPGLILSPHLSAAHPYLRGAAEMYEDGLLVTVDLDFLVDAQIRAYEDASAYGRYLCFNHAITTHDDAVQLAQALTSPTTTTTPPQPQSYDHERRMIQQSISSKKLNKLMMGFERETRGEKCGP